MKKPAAHKKHTTGVPGRGVAIVEHLAQDEQPGLFPLPDGTPPPAPTGQDLAVLLELANGGFTQRDWLRMGGGWRLAPHGLRWVAMLKRQEVAA